MNDNTFDLQSEEMSDDVFDQLMGDVPASANVVDTLVGTEKPSKVTKNPKTEVKEEPEEVDTRTEEEKQAEVDAAIDAATTGSDEDIVEAVGHNDTFPDADLFKAKAMGLIERGVWSEFEGMEDFDWTEESYGNLAIHQAEWKAQEMFEEMVDKSGSVGKTILNHIANGGNPDELISQFKEIKRVESLDISTDIGQENVVREYYSKIGWSKTRIDKQVKMLVDTNGLSEHATETKELLGEELNKQIEDTRKEQDAYAKEQKRLEDEFQSNMTKTVNARKDITDKEKKEILRDLLVYDQTLPSGKVVNRFALDFMKLQADPDRYVDLIAFVRNPDKYRQNIGKEKEKEAVKKTWSFIKGNAALQRNTGSQQNKSKDKGSDLKVDYKQLI